MAELRDDENTAYVELVQELLNCPQGEEHALLATRPELVDEHLVMNLLAVAQMLMERDGQEAESTAVLLVGFAQDLAEQLGLDIGGDDDDCSQEDLDFLNALIEAEQTDETQVPVLFAQNLQRLTPGLGVIMKWYTQRVVATRPEDAEGFVGLIENIVISLSDFPLGNRAQNAEIVLAGYEAVLMVRTKGNNPEKWAQTQNNLATAYYERIRGDKAENMELSIACYKAALEVYTQEDFPIDWAMTQNNLANAHGDRIRGDKAENMELSIACYKAALEVRTQEDFPIQWATTQNNLAGSLSNRIRGDKAENMELSIACYKAALEVYTQEDFPIDWATTQNNLANAHGDRIRGDKAENMELSIACYKAALEVYTQEDFPIDWAMTQNNLAGSLSNRIRGDKAENMELSIACYKAALEVRSPQNLPIDCLQSARNLGTAHFNQGNWQQAIAAYEVAMEAAETSRSWSVNDEERQRVLQSALSVYENAIQCAVNLKDYQQAIEYTERVRSRQLVELMASKDLYSDAQVPAEIQAYLDEYQQLNQSIQDLRGDSSEKLASSSSRDQRDSEQLRQSIEQIRIAEDRKEFLYRQIRTYDPVLAGQIEIAPISYGDIQKLITNEHTVILAFYSTDDDTHIFILKQNQEPELFTCTGQGYNRFQQWLIENWLKPYNQKDNASWREQMPTVLAEIADRLQINQLIINHLQGIGELVLVPHLLLHQIPFAALPIEQGLLGEKFVIRFIPSCQILKYCVDRPAIATTIQGLVEDADDSLIGARYEGPKIAEICEVRESDRLRGKTQATVANYRQLLGRINRLHSSHHAASRWDNPLESALQLGDGNITLGDLLLGERYPNLDEVFLSACETHVGKYTLTDDVATLTTGFLCAGARSVQSTLWSVNDIVTALFDIFYHQERRENYNRATSLKRAQVRLKNLSGEEFKLNHYPEMLAFIENEVKQLNTQIAALTKYSELWRQLDSQKGNLLAMKKPLQKYREVDRPFASPYFWAGFICQGMA
jgi:CHAT domain-containing protein